MHKNKKPPSKNGKLSVKSVAEFQRRSKIVERFSRLVTIIPTDYLRSHHQADVLEGAYKCIRDMRLKEDDILSGNVGGIQADAIKQLESKLDQANEKCAHYEGILGLAGITAKSLDSVGGLKKLSPVLKSDAPPLSRIAPAVQSVKPSGAVAPSIRFCSAEDQSASAIALPVFPESVSSVIINLNLPPSGGSKKRKMDSGKWLQTPCPILPKLKASTQHQATETTRLTSVDAASQTEQAPPRCTVEATAQTDQTGVPLVTADFGPAADVCSFGDLDPVTSFLCRPNSPKPVSSGHSLAVSRTLPVCSSNANCGHPAMTSNAQSNLASSSSSSGQLPQISEVLHQSWLYGPPPPPVGTTPYYWSSPDLANAPQPPSIPLPRTPQPSAEPSVSSFVSDVCQVLPTFSMPGAGHESRNKTEDAVGKSAKTGNVKSKASSLFTVDSLHQRSAAPKAPAFSSSFGAPQVAQRSSAVAQDTSGKVGTSTKPTSWWAPYMGWSPGPTMAPYGTTGRNGSAVAPSVSNSGTAVAAKSGTSGYYDSQTDGSSKYSVTNMSSSYGAGAANVFDPFHTGSATGSAAGSSNVCSSRPTASNINEVPGTNSRLAPMNYYDHTPVPDPYGAMGSYNADFVGWNLTGSNPYMDQGSTSGYCSWYPSIHSQQRSGPNFVAQTSSGAKSKAAVMPDDYFQQTNSQRQSVPRNATVGLQAKGQSFQIANMLHPSKPPETTFGYPPTTPYFPPESSSSRTSRHRDQVSLFMNV